MMITYGLAFIVIPYDVAFAHSSRHLTSSYLIGLIISFVGKKKLSKKYFRLIFHGILPSDIICLMDIAINFRTSFQDQRTKEIVLDGRKIACHYVRFYFWIDLLSSIPHHIFMTRVKDKKKSF
jgi:hypothetical protein